VESLQENIRGIEDLRNALGAQLGSASTSAGQLSFHTAVDIPRAASVPLGFSSPEETMQQRMTRFRTMQTRDPRMYRIMRRAARQLDVRCRTPPRTPGGVNYVDPFLGEVWDMMTLGLFDVAGTSRVAGSTDDESSTGSSCYIGERGASPGRYLERFGDPSGVSVGQGHGRYAERYGASGGAAGDAASDSEDGLFPRPSDLEFIERTASPAPESRGFFSQP
jgi:hypothetical protein